MKKFLYSSLIALAGIFAVSSCETVNEKVIFNPEEVTAPTAGELAGGVLAKDGADIVLEFGAADFNLDVANGYELQASQTEDFAAAVKVTAAITDSTATVKQSDLNSMILNFGVAPENETVVYFRIMAYLMNEKNLAVAGSETYSNVISAKFTPYNAVVPEKDTYAHVWVIGDYCGWDFAKTQFLYDYAKDKTTYSGIVDFADKAANGWKISGADKWQDDVNWGSESQGEEAEQSTIQLIASGGSKDIKAYSKRYYHFEFSTSSLVLKKNFGFDQVGIIGLNGDWENDIVMKYNPVLVRFYADIEVPAATEMKFRADADWTLNWGVDLAQGGGNIPVAAGNYRVYLDLNKNEFKLDATMFGKPETGVDDVVPEPEPLTWVVNGNFNNWGGEPVISMTNTTGDIWVAKKVKFAAIDEFKLTSSENAWVGGPEANAQSTIDPANPYDVYKPVLGTAFATGDKNIAVGAEGEYDITYDAANNTILVDVAKVNYWGVIGVNGEWNNDCIMKEVMPGIWMSETLEITSGDWKLRKNGDWAVNRGGAALTAAGEFAEVSQDGANIAYTPGKCIVVYNANTETVGTLVWGLVGAIASIDGFNWNADVPMNLGKDGKFYSVPVALTATDEFKVRYMGAWDDDRGGACEAVETAFAVTKGGSNIKAPADGTYMVVYDPATETITLTKNFWSLIGDFNSWGGDVFLMYDGAGKWAAYNQALTGGWKIRQGADWAMSVGGTYTAGAAFEAVSDNGPNITVDGLESFDVIYDTVAGTILVQ